MEPRRRLLGLLCQKKANSRWALFTGASSGTIGRQFVLLGALAICGCFSRTWVQLTEILNDALSVKAPNLMRGKDKFVGLKKRLWREAAFRFCSILQRCYSSCPKMTSQQTWFGITEGKLQSLTKSLMNISNEGHWCWTAAQGSGISFIFYIYSFFKIGALLARPAFISTFQFTYKLSLRI